MKPDPSESPLPTLRNLTNTPLTLTRLSKGHETGWRSHRSHGLIIPNQADLVVTFELPRCHKQRGNIGSWRQVSLQTQRREIGSKGDETVPLIPNASGQEENSIILPFKMYAKTDKDGNSSLMVLPRIDPARYLSDMPDDTSIADLMLPGTHESLARYGWPISQCQHPDCTLPVQLTEGIRFFDIRLRISNGILLAYHGAWPQRISFQETLHHISCFLIDHPRETLILCVQQETAAHPEFSRTVRRDMQGYIEAGQWFLDARVPELGRVRGKGILMSRFGGGAGEVGEGPWCVPDGRGGVEVKMGWRPNRWPDSVLEGFEWDCGESVVRTQDWYDIYGIFNIPAKFSLLTDHLRSGSHLPSHTHLTLSFASAGSIPLALPPIVAKGFGWPAWGLGWRGINELFRDWLLDRLEEEVGVGFGVDEMVKEGRGGMDLGTRTRLRGIVPMDYYRESGVIDVMLIFNAINVRSNKPGG